jgi:hypothetical protein
VHYFVIVAHYLLLLLIILFLIVYFILCLTLVFVQPFAFIHIRCLLFKRKRFNSDPGLYMRYFDPVVCEVPAVPLYKNTITIYESQ